jgi:hypothetical protein
MQRKMRVSGRDAPWVLNYYAWLAPPSRIRPSGVLSYAPGKNIRYLQSFLILVGIHQIGPTLLDVDNIAINMMVNTGKPTEQSRHIDIHFFALISWVKAGDIFLLPSRAHNPSDALTKALGWYLHHIYCFCDGHDWIALQQQHQKTRLIIAHLNDQYQVLHIHQFLSTLCILSNYFNWGGGLLVQSHLKRP